MNYIELCLFLFNFLVSKGDHHQIVFLWAALIRINVRIALPWKNLLQDPVLMCHTLLIPSPLFFHSPRFSKLLLGYNETPDTLELFK